MSNFSNRIEQELTERRDNALYRMRRIAESAQEPEMVIDGRKVIAFCSNDYLGLANNPHIIKTLCDGAQRWGTGAGAAHLINGHTAAHHALEEELAEFLAYPRALLFSTGYMANLGVISALMKKGDTVFEDKFNHASLLDAAQLSGASLSRYLHNDTDNLNTKLQRHTDTATLMVSDGIFSMDGDLAALPALSNIATTHDALLMIDDAHGIGVLGKDGRGTVNHFNLSSTEVPILMGTFGKAFGTSGAFVASSEDIIETLIQKARTYIYTTATPAALAEATRASLKIIQQDQWRRDQLQQNIQQLHDGLKKLNLPLPASSTAIQPVIIGDSGTALRISNALFNAGLLITAIRPPSIPKDTARLRITLSSKHTSQHINLLLEKLEKVLNSLSNS